MLKVFGDNTPKVLGLCFGEIFGSTQLLTFVFHWPSFHQHWSWESMQGTQKFDIWQVPIYVSNNTCLWQCSGWTPHRRTYTWRRWILFIVFSSTFWVRYFVFSWDFCWSPHPSRKSLVNQPRCLLWIGIPAGSWRGWSHVSSHCLAFYVLPFSMGNVGNQDCCLWPALADCKANAWRYLGHVESKTEVLLWEEEITLWSCLRDQCSKLVWFNATYDYFVRSLQEEINWWPTNCSSQFCICS